jgi:hypothetical protein
MIGRHPFFAKVSPGGFVTAQLVRYGTLSETNGNVFDLAWTLNIRESTTHCAD